MTDFNRAMEWLDHFTATEGWAFHVHTIKAEIERLRTVERPADPSGWREAIEAAAKWLRREQAHLILRMNRYADRFEKVPGKEPHAETVRQWVRELDDIAAGVRSLPRPPGAPSVQHASLREALEALARPDGFPYATDKEKLEARIRFAREALTPPPPKSRRSDAELSKCRCGGEPKRVNARHVAFIVRCQKCGAKTDLERCEIDADDSWHAGRLAVLPPKEFWTEEKSSP